MDALIRVEVGEKRGKVLCVGQEAHDIDVVARKAGLTVHDIPDFSRIDGGGDLGKAAPVLAALRQRGDQVAREETQRTLQRIGASLLNRIQRACSRRFNVAGEISEESLLT